MDTDWFFRLWGLPFLIVGAHAVVGRFFVDRWIRRRLRYFVTSKRILIQRLGPWASLRTLDLRRLPMLDTAERPDGSGKMIFGEAQAEFGWSRRAGWGASMALWHPALEPTPQFLGIRDVTAVRAVIERAADAAARADT